MDMEDLQSSTINSLLQLVQSTSHVSLTAELGDMLRPPSSLQHTRSGNLRGGCRWSTSGPGREKPHLHLHTELTEMNVSLHHNAGSTLDRVSGTCTFVAGEISRTFILRYNWYKEHSRSPPPADDFSR